MTRLDRRHVQTEPHPPRRRDDQSVWDALRAQLDRLDVVLAEILEGDPDD